MPHQCVKCSKIFKENSNEILKGCNSCGGKFFFFIKAGDEKKVKEVSSNLSLSDKEKIEQDVLDILGDSETDKPIILDLASISVINQGKFELDLRKLFKKEPLELFIKSYIKKIKDGKLDLKLIYRKSIRKSLEEYTKTTPPHVKAARQLDKLESNIIEYYQTIEGPEPIQKLRHKIDYDHYIEKQIAPIANQVLILLNKNFEDVTQSSKQAKLF